jgi:hypothetical protein
VHPWLAADAIRWYAEHPADREAIGTTREHERLPAAVGVAAYPMPVVVPLNSLTRHAVVWAVIPCLDPAMTAPTELQAPLLALMVVKRLGCLALAAAVLILLLLPSKRQAVGADRGAAPDVVTLGG